MKYIIILISVGVFQDYLKENIEQLLKLDYEIHVIVNKEFFPNLKQYNSIKIIDCDDVNVDFDNKCTLKKGFRNKRLNRF